MTDDQSYEISKSSIVGVPITGDYNEGIDWGYQKTPAEFAALLKPVLDDEEIIRFGWTQYTPHFNDGDTCEFGTYTPWFLTRADETKIDDIDDFDEEAYEVNSSYSVHPSIGGVHEQRTWSNTTSKYEDNPLAGQFTGPDRARYDRCLELSHAIEGSSCYRVLLDAFGDHAEITFSRDADTGTWSAHREFYSHD